MTAMTEAEVVALRKTHEMEVIGRDCPKPVRTFEEASVPEFVLKEIMKASCRRFSAERSASTAYASPWRA